MKKRAMLHQRPIPGLDEEPSEVGLETAAEEREVPSKSLYGIDLKSIPSFKLLRREYKLENQSAIFKRDVGDVLKHISQEASSLDVDLLVQICNIAEEFFIYGPRELLEQSKLDCIKELMVPYFLENEKVLEVMLKSVAHRVKKSTRWRRMFRRLKNYLF